MLDKVVKIYNRQRPTTSTCSWRITNHKDCQLVSLWVKFS